MDRRGIVLTAGAVAIVSFFGGTLLYQSQSEPPRIGPSQDAVATTSKSSEGPIAKSALSAPYIQPHSPILGTADAPVTISEFFDPACEACRAFHPIVKNIINTFPGKVRVALRYTTFHGPSKEAVAILEASRRQDKFIPVLEALLEKQPAWAPHGRPGQSPWEFLGGTGLDIERAKVDAKHPGVTAVINLDAADVEALRVRGTPTFFVNGKPLQKLSPQGLFDLVKQEVEAS